MGKFKFVLVSAFFALVTSGANAGLIQVQIAGNDCSGVFGIGFENCQIIDLGSGGQVQISPVIAKFDAGVVGAGGGAASDLNSQFSTITGNEWSFGGGAGTSGSWTYTPDDPQDPGIRYWAAKGGNQFNLMFIVPDAQMATCSAGNELTLACLSLAQTVTGGTWTTANGSNLSHLTFYDTEPPVMMPEPQVILLLGLGLIGLGGLAASRRK